MIIILDTNWQLPNKDIGNYGYRLPLIIIIMVILVVPTIVILLEKLNY